MDVKLHGCIVAQFLAFWLDNTIHPCYVYTVVRIMACKALHKPHPMPTTKQKWMEAANTIDAWQPSFYTFHLFHSLSLSLFLSHFLRPSPLFPPFPLYFFPFYPLLFKSKNMLEQHCYFPGNNLGSGYDKVFHRFDSSFEKILGWLVREGVIMFERWES